GMPGRVYPKTGYENYVPPAYVEQDARFYAGFGDGSLVEIPKRNRKYRNYFPNTAMKMRRFRE
ncbi:MAG: hypothetical protein ACOCWA_08095, partial [Bacteroidota bacterium]